MRSGKERTGPYFKAIFASVAAPGHMTLDGLTVHRLDISKDTRTEFHFVQVLVSDSLKHILGLGALEC